MPCNSDYMEANKAERNSKLTASCLAYAIEKSGREKPDNHEEIASASKNYYGNVDKLDEFVVQLCTLLNDFSEEEMNTVVYDGKFAKSRILAEWWEEHQAADAAREEAEREEAAKEAAIESAKSKLSDEEKVALGLDTED